MLTVASCASETLSPLGFSFVEFSTYSQARLGSRSGNEFDDCAKAAQGLPRQLMLMKEKSRCSIFIPLTGFQAASGHRDRELKFVGQFL